MRICLSKLLIIGLVSVVFTSCAGDSGDDTEKPTLENLTFRDDTVKIGEALIMTAKFSHNKQLSNYKMVIEANFPLEDPQFALLNMTQVGHFYYEDRIEFEKSKVVTKSDTLIIPRTTTPKGEITRRPVAKGKYKFTLFCIDPSGNEASISKYFMLDDPEPEN